MTELERLLEAWALGEDCWFAINDLLLDMGKPNEAEWHRLVHASLRNRVKRESCSLVMALREGRLKEHLATTR